MSGNTFSFHKKKELRTLFLFFICILVISCISIGVFYTLYQVSKNNIINMWNNNALEMFKDVEFYLNTPKDAVRFTSLQIEEMQKDGASTKEINQYLIDETAVYSTLIESNSTGIYGYVDGEYLDGSGWISPDDYNPLERPWYTAAKEADGEIALVKPFLNLQTNTMMMSVSVLLDDKTSVVSMDIFLDNIQEIHENMAENENVDEAMLIDKSGVIVSHSDSDLVGDNFLTDGNAFQTSLAKTVIERKQSTFTINTEDGEKIVFCNLIDNQWYAVMIISERNAFGSIRYIYVLSSLTIGAVFFIFFVLFSIYYRKQREVYDLQDDIQAVAGIFSFMYMVDLKSRTTKNLRNVVLEENYSLSGEAYADLDKVTAELANENFREMLRHFMDIDTFDERLRDMSSISFEYLDNDNKWNRIQLVVVSRDPGGSVSKVLSTIQTIDDDKRQQEILKIQAETDALTHILNRKGGEARLVEYLFEGKNGMLLLLDADNFKHVNDTYGHDVGDKVIIALADCLTSTFRESDVVYRMGGDEFAVFTPDVETEDIAVHLIDRLFDDIDNIAVEEITDWKMKISVGAVLCNDDNSRELTAIYKRGDIAMYESKQYAGNHYTMG